jgi:hypothetical protein
MPVSNPFYCMAPKYGGKDLIRSHKKDTAPVGKNTHKWIPKVGIRAYKMTKETVQLITNHGSFGEYLQRFNITTDSTCYCGEGPSNANHILTSCPAHFTHTLRETTKKFQDWKHRTLQDENLLKELEDLGRDHMDSVSRRHYDNTIGKRKKTGKKPDPIISDP